MKFPYYIDNLTKQQKQNFDNNFAENGELTFEGVWFRNQRKENKNQSNWKNEKDARRKYVHFFDKYIAAKNGNKDALFLKSSYVYVSNTLPKNDIKNYYKKIVKSLEEEKYDKIGNDIYQKEDLKFIINIYQSHPKDIQYNVEIPSNYLSMDVAIVTSNFDYLSHYERMWRLSTKVFRLPGKRENPTYIKDIDQLKDYFPAQIELGCGPSIEAGLPPLYDMHETYRVQNHISKKFYFGEKGDIILKIIKNPDTMYKKFSKVPKKCIKVKTTEAYDTFASLFKKGIFKGTVLNNNFDRIVRRYGIDEYLLRIYDKDRYLPKIKFEEGVKSLICIGTHADRRQVQLQARNKGLKVIFIDPEGFYENNSFINYPIEAPQNNDLILKETFENAMKEFKNRFL